MGEKRRDIESSPKGISSYVKSECLKNNIDEDSKLTNNVPPLRRNKSNEKCRSNSLEIDGRKCLIMCALENYASLHMFELKNAISNEINSNNCEDSCRKTSTRNDEVMTCGL